MKYAHGVEVRNVKKVWRDEICKFTRLKKETITRKEIEEKVGPIIQKHLDISEKAKAKICFDTQKMAKIENFSS